MRIQLVLNNEENVMKENIKKTLIIINKCFDVEMYISGKECISKSDKCLSIEEVPEYKLYIKKDDDIVLLCENDANLLRAARAIYNLDTLTCIDSIWHCLFNHDYIDVKEYTISTYIDLIKTVDKNSSEYRTLVDLLINFMVRNNTTMCLDKKKKQVYYTLMNKI